MNVIAKEDSMPALLTEALSVGQRVLLGQVPPVNVIYALPHALEYPMVRAKQPHCSDFPFPAPICFCSHLVRKDGELWVVHTPGYACTHEDDEVVIIEIIEDLRRIQETRTRRRSYVGWFTRWLYKIFKTA